MFISEALRVMAMPPPSSLRSDYGGVQEYEYWRSSRPFDQDLPNDSSERISADVTDMDITRNNQRWKEFRSKDEAEKVFGLFSEAYDFF